MQNDDSAFAETQFLPGYRPDTNAAPGATAADFQDVTRPGDLWPEAADARCSEQAALFAGTVPAPLTVV